MIAIKNLEYKSRNLGNRREFIEFSIMGDEEGLEKIMDF